MTRLEGFINNAFYRGQNGVGGVQTYDRMVLALMRFTPRPH